MHYSLNFKVLPGRLKYAHGGEPNIDGRGKRITSE